MSVNVLDLALSLPGAELVSLKLQDIGYDRSLMTHGLPKPATGLVRLLIRAHQILRGRLGLGVPTIQEWIDRSSVVDQTGKPDVLAQIQCIVRKGTRPS